MMRVANVDDEPLARAGLRLRLEQLPDIEVVGEAADGEAALALVRALRPQVVFLDVEMPGASGFDTLAQLAADALPYVIFVTAHHEHAVRAFEVNALDYLLKPVDRVRLAEAVRRAREELARDASRGHQERLGSWLASEAHAGHGPLTRFVVQSRGQVRVIPVDQVRWIASAANYIELHLGTETALVRMTLAEAEARLPEFARVHRARLVRRSLVRAIVPSEHGDFTLHLDSGEQLAMSRRYRQPWWSALQRP